MEEKYESRVAGNWGMRLDSTGTFYADDRFIDLTRYSRHLTDKEIRKERWQWKVI
ncbi:MAG: hypothetical protein QT00_C0002G0018 [archaeon GW2011_AR5]|nr:MAG: hypothetical protein QT00_C0002G0018 [archaeon GW2011_AR5]